MIAVQLSRRTLEICARHWNPPRTRCQGCPLASPCSAPVQPLTSGTLAAHTATLNAAAECVPAAL